MPVTDSQSEGMHFVRHEVREGRVVAVFRLPSPVFDLGDHGEVYSAEEETVLDRASLEMRLRNLRAAGRPASATAAALARWPDQGTSGRAA